MTQNFKIRRKSDGLFSEGGQGGWKGEHIGFSKKGKTWTTRGAVSNHFAQFHEGKDHKPYSDCEIVVYDVNPVEVMSYPVSDWMLADSTVREKELDEKRQAKYRLERIEAEKKELQAKLDKLNRG